MDIEHDIGMQVHILDVLLIKPIAMPGFVRKGLSITQIAVLSGTIERPSGIHKSNAQPGFEPLSYGDTKFWRNAMTKLHLLLVVTKKQLTAYASTHKCIVPETLVFTVSRRLCMLR
ncbi:MAG: hypothetical protein IIU97_02125 [Bacteroidaceae bacterium]|nr:hypothetical protein [Bacteroidaceae bacterium]